MLDNSYGFRFSILFSALKSLMNLTVPFCLGIMNDGAAHQDGLKMRLIVPSFSIKSNSSLNTLSLVNGTGYALFQDGV